MTAIKTKHLILQAMSRQEMADKAGGDSPEAAMYARHLARAEEQSGGTEKKPEWLFCTHWKILLKPAKGSPKGTEPVLIGDLYCKGKPVDGSVVIGYMIFEEYRKQGYGSEAVEMMVSWLEEQDEVFFIDADVEPDNTASVKLLEKCGFTRTGADAESGRLLYEHKKAPPQYMAIYMTLGLAIGVSIGSSRGTVGTSMCLGMAFGLAVGAAFDASIKKQLKKLEAKRAGKRG